MNLPDLPHGWDYLHLTIPVDRTHPVDADDVARQAGEAARVMLRQSEVRGGTPDQHSPPLPA